MTTSRRAAATERRRRRLLVVDDEEGIRTLAARALRARGYDVALAGSADDAASAIAASGPPALIVTDLSMPGTSGADFARAMLAAHAAVRVLVISGYADVELRRRPRDRAAPRSSSSRSRRAR